MQQGPNNEHQHHLFLFILSNILYKKKKKYKNIEKNLAKNKRENNEALTSLPGSKMSNKRSTLNEADVSIYNTFILVSLATANAVLWQNWKISKKIKKNNNSDYVAYISVCILNAISHIQDLFLVKHYIKQILLGIIYYQTLQHWDSVSRNKIQPC